MARESRKKSPASARDRLRSLPSVDRALDDLGADAGSAGWSRRVVRSAVRAALDEARRELLAGQEVPGAESLIARCRVRLERLSAPSPRRVINATGVVVHTNLGRAPLPVGALEDLTEAARYCDLEFDVEKGERGNRQSAVRELFALLFPDHDTLVVNNNAAAVLLALSTLAHGREVVISRGELVEIGGSFRVPEILERSGCRLREVGTTNRTHPRDYKDALGADTGLVLKVWPSNYRVVGFTKQVDVETLAPLVHAAELPLVVDQGCGRLLEDSPGVEEEISVEQLLEEGADLVCFSGDKLLGGPQCGVLIGDPGLIERCKRNQLARALRPGKLTLSVLTHVLRRWCCEQPDLPVPQMLTARRDTLRPRAEALAASLRDAIPGSSTGSSTGLDVVDGISRVGGGAAPDVELPTCVVRLRPAALAVHELTAHKLAERLRQAPTPIVVRVADEAVLFDPRTLTDDEFAEIATALRAAL